MSDTTPQKLVERVYVYRSGLCYSSVCAPVGMSREVIERQANIENPTGIESRWKVADTSFKDGTPNPCSCNKVAGRMHYLLVC